MEPRARRAARASRCLWWTALLLLAASSLLEADAGHVRRRPTDNRRLAAHHRIRHAQQRLKRQHAHVDRLLTDSYVVAGAEGVAAVPAPNAAEPEEGQWGPWSPPSDCSRSCGGGVASQTRQCEDPRGLDACRGGAKRYFSCNIQDCPEDSKDFRAEQCSEFDAEPFENRYFTWVPYTKAANPCELNCMPRGERFYYRHKQAVIDGTRCNDEKLDVCVEGQCLPVGCDMLLGSSAVEDKCRECRGDGSGCNTIEGLLDTDDLQVGYNDILLIPAGATNIRVHELKASNNYLAIRNESGHYYLNGNWRIDFPRSLRFAGTIFHYERVPHAFLAPESISALGPTREAIYVVLLYQATNPGIHYEYSIPKGVSQPTDPDSYTWIPGEFSECSVTCGGGFQVRNVSCIRRKDGMVVSSDLCNPSLEPRRNESCGTDPCLPEWSVGDWGSCSATCGEGVQTRQVYCERIVSNNLPSIVDDEQCLEILGPKPLTTQPCNQDVVCPTWHVGPWRPCDRLCGEGRHRRRVRCYRRVDGRIEVLDDSSCSPDKPEEEKPCLLRPCEGVDWILSEWSGCENKCGLTFETREAHCVNEAGVIYPEKFCQPYLLEDLKRPCTSPRPCDHEWFASQWSECSAECGTGIQTRKVFCGTFDGDTVKRVDNENCDLSKKYEDVQNCTGKEECQGQWYHGPWSKCDKECGGGRKVRQVLCLVANETADVEKCDGDLFPFTTEECNNHQCSDDEVIPADDGVSLEEECEEEDEIYFSTDTVLEATFMGKTELPSSVKDITTSEVGTVSADGLPSQTSTATAASSSAVSGLSSVSAVTLSESDSDTKGSPDSSISTAAMADEELMLSDAASIYEDADTGFTTDSYDQTTDDFGSTDMSFTEEPHTQDTSRSDVTSSEAPLTTSVPETTSGIGVTSTETSGSTDSQSLSDSLPTDTSSIGTTASDTDGSTSFGTTINPYETTVIPDTSVSEGSTSVDNIASSGSDEETVTTEISGPTSTATSSELETDSETPSSSTETSSSPASDESSSISTIESTSDSGDSTTVSSTISSEVSATTEPSDTEEVTEPNIAWEFDNRGLEEGVPQVSQQTTEGSSKAYTADTTDTVYSSSSDSSSLIPSTLESSSSSLTQGSSYPTEVSTSQESSTTEVLTSTETLTTEASTSTEPSETTVETSAESSTVGETSLATTVSPVETTEVSSETSTLEETASSVAQTTFETPEETTEAASKTTDEIFTGSTGISDYTPTKEAAVTTEKESLWETATTLRELITTIKSKGKKCRRRKKPKELKCEETKFGCCADGITKAQGPFSLGCPQLRTCDETKYGCCPDKVSPAKGPNWEGCPPSLCAETLFGCCPDNVSIAEGNDFEGCPEEELPFDCKTSEFGCCPDGITKASGQNNAGCFECEGSGECTCDNTKFGCCPDGITAATGPNNTGCYDELEGSGVTPLINTTETELDCTVSKHGCCPDGYLPATGPYFEGCGVINFENCSDSYFGCCPDQINPALGPNYIGCRMPCESEKYGCCRDGITPAHGPNEEGCCLNSDFGCCPDNVLPAQGPNLEGCGCEYTRYRCCPDNKTAARGPGNEGCGCEFTKHGCCPNHYTPAAGPNFEGCPCHTFQFGCCPDGITIARGLHNQGCGCENTEFGCCSDDKTPAPGPNKEGCGCEASKYGCCPDGVSEAQGDKFEGCEDAPIIASEICTLPKSRGSCRDFTVKWFFDTEYGGCSRFWYGGCEGNDNRFKTQEECKNVCVEPPGREACFLPKITGPCEGYYPTWYYDSERKQCGQFIYGGCLGNNNKFQTREECEELCVLPDTIDACEQAKDAGPCNGNYRRWYFNKADGVCEEFAYGGCKGNRNNFLTEAACLQQCLQPGRSRESCSLPRDEGNCTDRIPRWFFDVSENRCMPFYYSGCGGNANKFETEKECEADCPPKVEQDICTLTPVVGDQCYNYTERWYYDSTELRCRQFYYTGCGGNENNFLTLQDCENRCEKRILTSVPPAEFRKDSCFLPDEHGPCEENMAKWFYDSRDGVCKQFLYGGCEGNDNRFSSQQECEEKCGDVQDICNLPRVVGPCSGSFPQWYYDRNTDSCYEFDYGGCQGNKNKFDDRQQCEQYCKKYYYTTSSPDLSSLLLTTQDPRINEIGSIDICSARVDPGPCQDSIVSWYYDERTGRCGSFAYGGCGGNANRFQSEEQCERQCGAFKGQDVCNIPHDVGDCQDALEKWYYDGTSRSCRQFSYTGCGGNGNRFSSLEECESVCLQYQEVHPLGNDTALSRQAICRLPVDSGPCSGGYHKRWYYDDMRQTCIPFIYTGCGGNFNRFKNFQSCLSFCSILLQEGYDDKPEDKSEEVDCTSAKENCNLLQCPYGIERFVNADNCEICQCHEPCKDHICPDGTRCAVDLYQNTVTDDTEFRAVCRPVYKPGECPKLVEATENCIQECQTDADCTDINKCCFSGCGSSCLKPVYPEQILTTERPVVQPQPPYGSYDEPPSIDLTESDVQAEEGSYATLKCIAQGRPTPRIVWRKGTATIDGSSGRYRLLLDGSLQIIGLYRSDAGVYICTADNGIGQPAQKETHLKVTDPHPRPAEIIGEDSTYVVVTLGAPTSLHCYAVGWPRPSVTWWRGERLLPLSSEQYEQRRDYSLLIRSVALRQLGPYTCQAYNGQGKATSWTVTVQAIGPVYSNNPIDRDYFQYLVSAPRRAPERNKTESSQPRPSYPYRPHRPPYRPRPAATQTIPIMTMTTTTTTTTPQPVDEREDEDIVVPEQPRVFVVPVQVNVTVDRTVYPVGSEISIACDVDGYPIPQVQWFKDDNPLQIGNRIQVSESHRLQISRAEGGDSGTYRCAASNQYSASSSTVSIVVEGIYIHPNCTDNPFFANCSLIVKGQYCTHKYYAHFCCKSCTLAGQLPSYGPHLERTGTSRIDGRRK